MTTSKYLTGLGLGLAMLAFQSCNHEAPITAELGTPEYLIEDGQDYVTHTIYDIYKETGVKLVYTFNPFTAIWDLGASNLSATYIYIPFFERKEHTMAENMPVIEENLVYLKRHFIDCYDTDFKKKYFPARIFLSDSVRYRLGGSETLTGFTRDNIALNLYREGETLKGSFLKGEPSYETKEAYFKDFAPKAHFALWQFIFKYRASAPELFFSYSKDLYGKNLGEVKDKNYSIKQDGFWTYDELNSSKYYRAWKADRDIADYVLRMVMYTEEENRAEMAGYQIMLEKYNALRGEIKTMTGIDLQTIGDTYAPFRKEMENKIKAQ